MSDKWVSEAVASLDDRIGMIEMFSELPKKKQKTIIRRLRSTRRVILACGKMTESELTYLVSEYDQTANWKIVALCQSILRAREAERRGK
jgi:hypothetical protein